MTRVRLGASKYLPALLREWADWRSLPDRPTLCNPDLPLIDALVARLPIGERCVIEAHFIDRRTAKALARDLGLSVQAIGELQRAGLRMLEHGLQRARDGR